MKKINVTLCSNEKTIFLKVSTVSCVKSIPVKNSFSLEILQYGPAQTLQSGNDSGDNTTWQIMFNLLLINHIAQQRPLSPWRKTHFTYYSSLFSTLGAHIWNTLESSILHITVLQKGTCLLWQTYLADCSVYERITACVGNEFANAIPCIQDTVLEPSPISFTCLS